MMGGPRPNPNPGKPGAPTGGMGQAPTMKKGGKVKSSASKSKYSSGGSVSSASKRADGIAMKGKTRGKMC
jgi:hypothetical protein